MPIDEIYYHKSAEGVNRLGLHSWKKFGARYSLIPGENIEDAKKELMQFVDENIKQQNIPDGSVTEDGLPIIQIKGNNKEKLEQLKDLIKK